MKCLQKIFNKIKKKMHIKTSQDLVYQQKKNSYHLSMPNMQYVNDKNLEEIQVNQLLLMAMNDPNTNKNQ